MNKVQYLPLPYQERMKKLLGEEYVDYLDSFQEKSVKSLRLNTGKTREEELLNVFSDLEKIPWVAEGYYYSEEKDSPSRHPYYAAGVYYLQEASAMTPGSVLPVEEGDAVLDLCAAPGGKATQIGARLKGTGVLYANDISVSRAQALLKNLEMAGVPNIFVTAETPEHLAEKFSEFFDKILVDAPCSGEGMFRPDPAIVKDCEERGPLYYAPLQRQILTEAITMLKPGGKLLFSTCTFSPEEDEENVAWILDQFPQMKLCAIPMREGFSQGEIPQTVRLWPQRVRGEGHFLALFQKEGEVVVSEEKRKEGNLQSLWQSWKDTEVFSFCQKLQGKNFAGKIEQVKDSLYLLPPSSKRISGIRYLRTGLFLGEWKKGRFAPSQALAMALKKEDFSSTVDFSCQDERVVRYLKGETITCEDACIAGEEGWCLVCVDSFPLCW